MFSKRLNQNTIVQLEAFLSETEGLIDRCQKSLLRINEAAGLQSSMWNRILEVLVPDSDEWRFIDRLRRGSTGWWSGTPSGYVLPEQSVNFAEIRDGLRRLLNTSEVSGTPAAQNKSIRDSLTNLWARGKMNQDLADNFAEAAQEKQPLSLLMIDLDHFKQVNDSHGHLKGDVVLAEVAERVAEVVSRKGQAYRFGGEEFLVILPNHSIYEAVAVAERARIAIETKEIGGLKVTASFGIGTFPYHGSTSEEVIASADKALYEAKNLGRNLVKAFGEVPIKTESRRN